MKIKRLGRFLSICMCILKILLKSINIVITYEQLKMVKIFFYNKFKNFYIFRYLSVVSALNRF